MEGKARIRERRPRQINLRSKVVKDEILAIMSAKRLTLRRNQTIINRQIGKDHAIPTVNAPLAQLDRALVYGTKG